MNIGEKMFAYIDVSRDLTLDMVQQYKNAMIILGDEKQLFNPLTNSYVGIGQTAYEWIKTQLQSGNEGLNGLDAHLHQNTVNSIYSNYAPSELIPHLPDTAASVEVGGHIVTQNNYRYQLQANKDVVLKGIYDYDPTTKKGITSDIFGNPIVNPSTYGTSGITVNIEHNGNHVQGTDEFGFEYSYWQGQDYITIDDRLTWSYITSRTSYLMNFAKTMAVQQANRVYKDILGVDVVYIEKEFNEAFLWDQYSKTLEPINQVYVKLDGGNFVPVEIRENNGDYAIVINQGGTDTILWSTNDSVFPAISSANIASILDENGGYETSGGENIPVWYHVDMEHTANVNQNIADGINTIKEISYILDRITDGDEDGVSLAYNIAYNFVEIQKIKQWQENLGENTVNSFQSQSRNDLLVVSYYSSNLWDPTKDSGAIGDVKLDIDLILAQTYKDSSNNTQAAYLNANHTGANTIYRYVRNYDKTNLNNYRLLGAAGSNHQLYEDMNACGITSVDIYVYNGDHYEATTSGTLTESFLDSNAGNYIYFNINKVAANVETGITTVPWVTSYVGAVVNELLEAMSGVNDDVLAYINDKINELDYTDTEVEGQYVSEVSEENGVISVKRKKLPLSYLLTNEAIYNGDIFLHINGQELTDLFTLDNTRRDLYYLDSGEYKVVTGTSGIQTELHDKYFIKKNLSSFTEVIKDTPATDLIKNGANTSYYIKETELSGKVKYTPIDVQTELYNQVYFDSAGLVLNNEEIYWLAVNSLVNTKYIESRYVQHKDGHTDMTITTYITPLQSASPTNTGLADAWNVRQTIESMFAWVNLKTNKIII